MNRLLVIRYPDEEKTPISGFLEHINNLPELKESRIEIFAVNVITDQEISNEYDDSSKQFSKVPRAQMFHMVDWLYDQLKTIRIK